MDILEGLNLQQRQAVTAPPGAILVLAGPGSGKTRVLTHRIAYLIGTLGVRPYSILAMTFTNKAAKEMQTRVEKLLGSETQGLWLGTFHASCARILRREAEFLPVESNFVIFDADDQEVVVKSIDTGQVWIVNSYATEQIVKSDVYYRENLVLSDLPAGAYTITTNYVGTTYKQTIRIHPGMVSYFTFLGTNKFSTSLPPTPGPDFMVTSTKTP